MTTFTTTMTIIKEISTQELFRDMQRVKFWTNHKKKCQIEEHHKGAKQAQNFLYRLGQKYGMTVKEVIEFARQY